MNKILILLAFIFPCMLLSCTKEGAGFGNQTYYGAFSAELLALPGATTLDVYVEGTKIDTLAAGRIIGNDIPKRLTAGETTTISFKKAGTNSVVLDTTITVTAGEKVGLKIAYSEALGINAFTAASDGSVGADSTAFFLFNGLPEGAVAEEKVDVYLFKMNKADGSFEETDIVFKDAVRGKLHPHMTTIRMTDDDGSAIIYTFKIKSQATGAFIVDGIGSEYLSPYFEAGKREIITLNAIDLGGLYMFLPDYAIY